MLLHHDSRDYEEVASEAAAHARGKLEALISRGRKEAGDVFERIANGQPVDRLVRARAVRFEPCATAVVARLGEDRESLHPNALRQVATRAGLPWTYASKLLDQANGGWGSELLAHNLNRLFTEQFRGSDARFLTRSVDGEVRGFLSDRYRRLDSRPLLDSFAEACSGIGAVPVDGFASPTKVGLKALLPAVYEPVKHEILAFGVSFENSDFGNGALSIRGFVLRLWCTNFAITQESIRAVHLGSRLNDTVRWSERTRQLDVESMSSAIGDVVKGQLAKPAIDEVLDGIRAADKAKVSPGQVSGFLRKHLSKGEAQAVTEAFNSPDVEMMPAGQTVWRLSNALSWVAQQKDNPEVTADYQKLAGQALALAGRSA